jgi:hypothetical protein
LVDIELQQHDSLFALEDVRNLQRAFVLCSKLSSKERGSNITSQLTKSLNMPLNKAWVRLLCWKAGQGSISPVHLARTMKSLKQAQQELQTLSPSAIVDELVFDWMDLLWSVVQSKDRGKEQWYTGKAKS